MLPTFPAYFICENCLKMSNKESKQIYPTAVYTCRCAEKCVKLYLDIAIAVCPGCRTLYRVSKLPGRWVLRGSMSQWRQGGSANCVEVQQCNKTLSALQHQLHTIVSRCRSQTHKYKGTHTVTTISHPVFLCFSCTVMDERGCPVDSRAGWVTLTVQMLKLCLSEQTILFSVFFLPFPPNFSEINLTLTELFLSV